MASIFPEQQPPPSLPVPGPAQTVTREGQIPVKSIFERSLIQKDLRLQPSTGQIQLIRSFDLERFFL